MGMYDDVGDDDLGTLEVGWNPFRRRKKGGRGLQRRRGYPPPPRANHRPGRLPRRTDLRLQPLGMGASAFVVGGATILSLQQFPQRPFDGKRIVVDVTRSNAGASANGLLTMTRLDIGSDNQLVGSGSLSVGSFIANGVDVNLELDRAVPGIQVTMQFNISAAPTVAGDRVDFSATIFGVSLPI